MSQTLRSRHHRALQGILRLSALLFAFSFFIMVPEIARAANDSNADPGDLSDQYTRLRAQNAILRARLSLSKENEPYLILDLPGKELRLELQGVTLIRVPVRTASLNRLAHGVARDTSHISFCEVPFVLQKDRWFEEGVRTLALKDSAAVMNRPDTTGTLVRQIRTASVLSLLQFDRNLLVILDGNIPLESRIDRWKKEFRDFRRSFQEETPEWLLAREKRRSVMIQLDMEPASVRTLAPNLRQGTKLILRF
jgi:hypothetical protein